MPGWKQIATNCYRVPECHDIVRKIILATTPRQRHEWVMIYWEV